MIGYRKIHTVDADVGSQLGGPREQPAIPAQARGGSKVSLSAHGEDGPGDEEPPWYTLRPGTPAPVSWCRVELNLCSSPRHGGEGD